MITFACPTCAKSYSVSPENANKRTKCTQCRSPLVVPGRPEDDWGPPPAETLPVALPTGRPTPPPPVKDCLVVPEPECYRSAERCSTFLVLAYNSLAMLGIIVCLLGALMFFFDKGGTAAGFASLGMALLLGVSIVATELSHQLVLVFVSLARTARAMRDHQNL